MAEEPPVAVVTGGAGGIGLGITRHLLGQGTAVVVADVDTAACDRLGKSADQRLRVVVADVGTEEGAAAAIEAAKAAFGGIDLLCNNAGVHPVGPIDQMDLAAWRETFRVNLESALLCSRAALPAMEGRPAASIINIASISGLIPYAQGAAYASSKAALIMLTKVLALEYGPLGVRVNCICPGSIRETDAGQGDAAHIPVGRRGLPEDVAHMVSYLASDGAGYVNGGVFVLDGGATAGRPRPR